MDPSFEMTIGSDIGEIPAVSAGLEETMAAHGFYPEEILDTQLAVEEIITNVIVHGYKNPGGEIHITCQIAGGLAEIEVADTAPAFNPLAIPEPDLGGDIAERRIGGLGIYLVRQVMDEVSYRRENGKNILTMKKRSPH
jgi:anti-sigma regulatory factor (Ser/Thr protein kinase)